MLARTQLRQIATQLLTRVPDLTVGEGEMLRSNFVHAVTTPCSGAELVPDGTRAAGGGAR